MKKIGIFTWSLGRGGAERVTLLLSMYFHNNDIDVLIVTATRAEQEYNLPNEIRRISLTDVNEEHRGVKYASTVPLKMYKVLCREKLDVLLVMSVSAGLIAIPISFIQRLPVVISERNDPEHSGIGIAGIFSHWLMRFANGFVFQTEDALNFYKNICKDKVVNVIPNPLILSNLPEVYTGERTETIVSVGRLHPQKNQKMLLEAFSRLATDYPLLRLCIYGEGPMRPELEQMVRYLNLKDKVVLPGNTENVAECIKDARLFVMTSDYEGMPNALMEAMAVGLPCISTDCPCGGPRTLIVNGRNGILVPVGDIKKLEENIRILLDDDDYTRSLSLEAVKIRKNFSIHVIGEKWRRMLSMVSKCYHK